jgi:hypothetical protein
MNEFSITTSACVGNHVATRYFCFNDIYPSGIHKERHLVTLVVFLSSSTLSTPTTHFLGIMMHFFSSLRTSM